MRIRVTLIDMNLIISMENGYWWTNVGFPKFMEGCKNYRLNFYIKTKYKQSFYI